MPPWAAAKGWTLEEYERWRNQWATKGGRPKKETEENPKNRTVIEKTEGFSEKPKKADTESDTESDTDTESDIRESTREKTPPRIEKHGENGKVELTDDEFNRLAEQMGVSKRNDYIELRASSEK